MPEPLVRMPPEPALVMTRLLLATAICAGLLAALLTASHYGEKWRCQRLTAEHAASASLYCNGATK